MTLGDYDFDRAAPTRAAMRAAAVAGQPHDIAAALQLPDVPDELLARPLQVVTDLSQLRGAATGAVQVPDELADAALAGEVDVNDSGRCSLLYQRAMVHGSSTLQTDVLNSNRLVQLWPDLVHDLPSAITQVWQQRFPELVDRGAAWTT
ncbi:hypothetical protein [Streptomyces chartreusis]|uniref:Uncharacterized protein n=1 Tax=Streptomyces chartreusis TaxID=1969 RepID=A0A7H8TLN6_STRCX|nr:hypothetical protein [Streptomyces chartreusis]QKZ24284.1 hypothetical protein HUT05_47255 [Streptomyces chartreusis]